MDMFLKIITLNHSKNNIIKMFMNYKKINSKLKVNRDTFLNENLLKKSTTHKKTLNMTS